MPGAILPKVTILTVALRGDCVRPTPKALPNIAQGERHGGVVERHPGLRKIIAKQR